MKQSLFRSGITACWLLAGMSLVCSAQQISPPLTPSPEDVPPGMAPHVTMEFDFKALKVGSATDALLELQRTQPARSSRVIDGDQAARSYQRYLKSFEYVIPEYYSTGMGLEK